MSTALRQVRWICECCGKTNTLETEAYPKTVNRMLRFAICVHCGNQRIPYEIDANHFQCKECLVVFRRTRGWSPIKGLDPNCYMRKYRKYGKKMQPEENISQS